MEEGKKEGVPMGIFAAISTVIVNLLSKTDFSAPRIAGMQILQ